MLAEHGIDVSVVGYENEIYAFGGMLIGKTMLNTVRKYNSSADEWQTMKPMNRFKNSLAAFVVKN